ncbi:MAG: 23S rRNA (adenine(2503)-C(2))-methyltransferase RlmN [Lachnospiraceae bacterium]|nr:23S rRNA (adenine(2503)-C(2))-methyltransferase RlmN [Lachnospiraceae bacterium]
MTRPDVRSMSAEELCALMESMGEKKFRASQIFSWVHARRARSFGEMTDLSAALRARLAETCDLTVLSCEDRLVSKLDGTEKYLFALPDGNVIESVLMLYRYGASVCLSSQAGCRMGCSFCASTMNGLARNLTAGEMLEQIYRAGEISGKKIGHAVVMGSGEPLDNYDNLVRFLRLLSAPEGAGLSLRNVTVSTCGLVPEILRLAQEKFQITLALSLHAPNDDLRKKLMPVANKYPLADVLAACDAYFEATGRRVTYEYSLIRGVNDGPAEIRQLASLLRGKNCHVNLIPVNPVEEKTQAPTDPARAAQIKQELEKCGISATIRREMGRDIQGACGQLRRSWIQAEKREGGGGQ